MNKKKWHTTPQGLALVALVILLAFILSSGALKHRIDVGAAWVLQLVLANPVRGAVFFVLFSAFSAMMAFASSAVLVPTATAVWGRSIAFLLLWGGWMLGAALSYGIGRLMTPLLIRLGYGKKLAKYRAFVAKGLGFWSILAFCLAVPSEIPGYLLGGAHYPILKFLAAMAIAEAVYALALILIGQSLLTVKPSILIAGFIVVVVAGVLVPRMVRALRE